MILDPAQAAPGDIYKLMIGSIVPRPIAFVSSLSATGIRNLAPFSFFTAISANPPVICFSPMIPSRGSAHKDTLANVEATREFVVNIVSESIAAQMNICSGEYPPQVDEFIESGLTPIASETIAPPRVAECLISMECRLLQVVHISPKPLGGSLVIGEITRFHVDDTIITDFKIDPDKLQAVGRMGGPSYTRTQDRFDLARPVLK